MSGRWPIVVAMLAAVACSSAAAPYREYEIRFDAPAPPSLDQSPSDGELIDAIAWLMRHRLDLPFPADIKRQRGDVCRRAHQDRGREDR